MASAWGASFSKAWGPAWGQLLAITPEPPTGSNPGAFIASRPKAQPRNRPRLARDNDILFLR